MFQLKIGVWRKFLIYIMTMSLFCQNTWTDIAFLWKTLFYKRKFKDGQNVNKITDEKHWFKVVRKTENLRKFRLFVK